MAKWTPAAASAHPIRLDMRDHLDQEMGLDELLLDPVKPVTEIAASIGYQTPSAFSTAFRAVEGITPSEFRRRL